MSGSSNNAGGDQSNAGEQEQQNNQGQGAGAGNGGDSGNKREFEQLPDDHPLVKRLEQLKAENKVLKPKAKQVDDAEAAKLTDAEKIAKLQSEVDGLPKQVAASLREHLVELHGIEQDDAELFLTGDTPELLLKQVARLLDQSGAGASKRKNYVSKEGNSQRKPAEDENGAFAKSLFGGSDD